MLELCLRDLSPCSHVMLSQRRRLRDVDPFGRSAERFLSLTPNCCSTSSISEQESQSISHQPARWRGKTFNNDNPKSPNILVNSSRSLSDASLYGNYHAYLSDARQKIAACQLASSNWSNKYDGEPQSEQTLQNGDSNNLTSTHFHLNLKFSTKVIFVYK